MMDSSRFQIFLRLLYLSRWCTANDLMNGTMVIILSWCHRIRKSLGVLLVAADVDEAANTKSASSGKAAER